MSDDVIKDLKDAIKDGTDIMKQMKEESPLYSMLVGLLGQLVNGGVVTIFSFLNRRMDKKEEGK